VRNIRPPPGVGLLAADEAEAAARSTTSRVKLFGDVVALNLVDLDKEGLAEYKSQVVASLDSGLLTRTQLNPQLVKSLNEMTMSTSVKSDSAMQQPPQPPPRPSTRGSSRCSDGSSSTSSGGAGVSISAVTYVINSSKSRESENVSVQTNQSDVGAKFVKVMLKKKEGADESEDKRTRSRLDEDENYLELKSFYSRNMSMESADLKRILESSASDRTKVMNVKSICENHRMFNPNISNGIGKNNNATSLWSYSG
jgi:hypothetical protein